MPKSVINTRQSSGRFLVPGLCAIWLSVSTAPALAQNAPAPASGIINGWFEALDSFENVSASYGSLVPGSSSRSIDVVDGVITWTIPSGSLLDDLTASLEISFSKMEFTGLRQSKEMISADTIEIPGDLVLKMEFQEQGAAPDDAANDNAVPKTDDTVTKTVAGMSGNVDAAYSAVTIEGFSIPRKLPDLGLIEQSPTAFVRAALDLTRQVSIKRSFIETATANTTTTDTGTSSAVYEGLSFIGMADGRVAEQHIAEIRTVESPIIPGADGLPEKVEFKAGPIFAHGMDLVPLAALFGAPEEEGRTQFLDREEILNMEFSAEDAKGELAAMIIEDISVPNPQPLKLLTLIERDAKGENVTEDEFGFAAIEAMGALSIGRMELAGMEIEAEGVEASLRRFLVKNLSGDGLGEFSLSDFAVAVDGEGEGSFDYAGILGISFPAASALMALDQVDDPTPQQVLDAMPTLDKILVSAAEMNSITENVSFNLDLFELVQGSYVGKIPTRASLILDGLFIPTEQVADRDLKKLLQDLQIEELGLNKSMSIAWDPNTQDLRLSDLSFELKDGGRASLALTLGQVPKTIFTAPQQAQTALASATFKGAELRVIGAEVVTVFLKTESAKNQISPEMLAEGLIESLRGEMGPLAGTAFSEELLAALRDFLKQPDELVVAFEPSSPVPMAEILGLAITGPQALPERLGARVAANPE